MDRSTRPATRASYRHRTGGRTGQQRPEITLLALGAGISRHATGTTTPQDHSHPSTTTHQPGGITMPEHHEPH